MKKPVKKAAKKAAPRKKLIDGKYSHKFLVRLSPASGEVFERLKKQLDIKTYNGTIEHLIENFLKLSHANARLASKLGAYETQIIEQNNIMQYLAHGIKHLMKMDTKKS